MLIKTKKLKILKEDKAKEVLYLEKVR